MSEAPLNRISLRVPADLFRRLEDKRHAERTTFQEIGLRLFEGWLSGAITTGVPQTSDLSHNQTGVSSPDGPSTSLSPDSIRQIVAAIKAELAQDFMGGAGTPDRPRRGEAHQPKRRAKSG